MNQMNRRLFIKTASAGTAMLGITNVSVAKNRQSVDKQSSKVPENEKNLTILFQGDSITDGNRARNNDLNHIMGHGYAYAIASRIGADFPQAGFTFYNRGLSGNKVSDLQRRWQADTLDLKPDVLSLLVGINDVQMAVDTPDVTAGLDEFNSGYRQLLDACKQKNPNILIVLGVPFVQPVGPKRRCDWDKWHKETTDREVIVRQIAADYNTLLVDYPAMFDRAFQEMPPSYWVHDGIHPSIFGHELMAREWIKQTSSKLSFLKKYTDEI
jgi:lysophospholipase L1-like esterase